MSDTEKVISGMEHCGVGLSAKQCDGCPYAGEMNCDTVVYADALKMLKEQQERLNSIVCFENGDQVRIWHCPLCKSEVRIVLKNWNVIEDHLLGIKKVVERPQDIRVVTDDERVIVLKKEIPTMVMKQTDWSDNDA